jgi:hypothetical protein
MQQGMNEVLTRPGRKSDPQRPHAPRLYLCIFWLQVVARPATIRASPRAAAPPASAACRGRDALGDASAAFATKVAAPFDRLRLGRRP